MKVTLIYNPDAGSDNQPTGDQILKLIRDAGHSAVLQLSKVIGWEKALERAADVVAVAGGDGIVGKVAKHAIGKGAPLAILPMGTANNVANALGLADKPLDQLIAGWTGARRREFDVGAVSGPWGSTYFIEGLGMGLFTDTMSRLEARKNIDIAHHNLTSKKLASVLEIMNLRLKRCPAIRLRLLLDDRDLSGEYVLAETMNIPYVGPNLCLAPSADPGDGLLDVVLVLDDEREQLKRYLSDRLEGKSDCAVLNVYKGRHLRIECDCFPVHIDDDLRMKNGPPT
ncbi:MAG TPA: diacylglycerol kinase family protein, partial [Candidatus Binatia bacterium]